MKNYCHDYSLGKGQRASKTYEGITLILQNIMMAGRNNGSESRKEALILALSV